MKQSTNILHNIYSREELTKKLFSENFNRTTLSFYRYVNIDSPQVMRNLLYYDWNQLNVLGRIYLAKEGINAQLSVPEHHFEEFKNALYLRPEFKDVPFKIAIEDEGKSFIKLIIKVRNKIVLHFINIRKIIRYLYIL